MPRQQQLIRLPAFEFSNQGYYRIRVTATEEFEIRSVAAAGEGELLPRNQPPSPKVFIDRLVGSVLLSEDCLDARITETLIKAIEPGAGRRINIPQKERAGNG